MSKKQVSIIARSMGIKTARKRKAELILEIQKTEGNFPCYGTAASRCDQHACAWRVDCLK